MTRVFIIAEAGVNHNGSISLALKLCEAAKYAGADAVKFQTYKTEKLVIKNAGMAEYQKKNIGKGKSQFQMLKELQLGYDDFVKIKRHCDKIGIKFLSTPDEEDSLDFLVSLGIKTLKIGSGEVTNIPFLRKIGKKKAHVILSTGMADLDEVKVAYDVLLKSGAKSVALLHCVTNYPCPMEEVNLNAIKTLKKNFGARVGYSDHTLGVEVPVAAVALGAEIIEKHFTLDKTIKGPDHKASLEPHEFKSMVYMVRNTEKAMGVGLKKPSSMEMNNRKLIRKSIVAAKSIRRGERFNASNLTTKRPGTGISPVRWDEVIGVVSKKDFKKDELIKI